MWLWILFVPVAVVVLAFVVGFLLPERYDFEESRVIPLAPAAVWERLQDPERYPVSGSMCRGVELLPRSNGLGVWTEDLGHSTLRMRDVEADAPRHIVREYADSVVPMTARAELWIEPADGGSRVRYAQQLTIRSGTWHVPIFRIMVGAFGAARAGMRQYLRSLGG